jgi:hypothetical protein
MLRRLHTSFVRLKHYVRDLTIDIELKLLVGGVSDVNSPTDFLFAFPGWNGVFERPGPDSDIRFSITDNVGRGSDGGPDG